MNRYLDIAPEVKEALDAGKPIVALESTIISHGMPYPQNVETALKVESIIREAGAVPATIAIIGGRLKAGFSAPQNKCPNTQPRRPTSESTRKPTSCKLRQWPHSISQPGKKKK